MREKGKIEPRGVKREGKTEYAEAYPMQAFARSDLGADQPHHDRASAKRHQQRGQRMAIAAIFARSVHEGGPIVHDGTVGGQGLAANPAIEIGLHVI